MKINVFEFLDKQLYAHKDINTDNLYQHETPNENP